MRIRFFLYRATRILLGIFLILYSAYNVINYSEFLDRLDTYFNNANVFNIELIEAFAPLVPFEEFVIGMFLILGIFTREVLIATIVLFTFFVLFFLDVNYWNLAFASCILSFVAIVLLKKSHYDIHSMSYNKNSYGMIR